MTEGANWCWMPRLNIATAGSGKDVAMLYSLLSKNGVVSGCSVHEAGVRVAEVDLIGLWRKANGESVALL